MSEQILQQILSELKEIKAEQRAMKLEQQAMKLEQQSLRSQLEENTQLIKSILHRQEETDAKLEALSMDVNKLHGELTSVKDSLHEMKSNMATKDDLTYFDKKTAEHDRELFKLKHRTS